MKIIVRLIGGMFFSQPNSVLEPPFSNWQEMLNWSRRKNRVIAFKDNETGNMLLINPHEILMIELIFKTPETL